MRAEEGAAGDARFADPDKRNTLSPQVAETIGERLDAEVGLTGQTVANIEISKKLADALPVYLAIVIGLSLLLLLAVFRSLLVPLVATGGFLLSVGAAFGTTVAADEFIATAAAKVGGLARLAEYWPLRPDARILVCSSVSGLWGGLGHVAYAAVNRMQDVLAGQFRAKGLDCVAVRWGLWPGAGIVGADEVARIERAGLREMEPDIAIEAADVVLMSGSLQGVPNAIALSKATIGNIRQNLFWAFAYNTALVPVAAGVLYPAYGILLSPVFAAGAMALSSVFVLGNALRLKTFKVPG